MAMAWRSGRRVFCGRRWLWTSAGGEVGVFWDLNKCGVVLEEVDPLRVAPNIVQALRSSGLSGPISIHAFGNTRSLNSHTFLQALFATGVYLHHVPGGVKDLNSHLLVELLLWAKENSPPAHMLLISSTKEFSNVMHRLHMRGYNILLAHPEGDMSPDLLSVVYKTWVWDSIVKGNGPVVRPGMLPKNNELPRSESVVNSSQDFKPELDVKADLSFQDSIRKPQCIPKKVVKQVVDIIRLRPNGVTVASFKRQLMRLNVVLDKDLYGHKDLLSFLLSIPELKASLVWTSEKTRAYLFTEDSTKSHITNDSKENSKVASPAEHETFNVKEDKTRQVGTVLGSNCLDSKSANKEDTKEKRTSAGLSNVEALPAWRRVLSKFVKALRLMGPKAAKTDAALSETAIDHKGENRLVEAETFSTFQILEKHGKHTSSRERVQGDVPTSAAPKAAKTHALRPETTIDCKDRNQFGEAEAFSTSFSKGQPLFPKISPKERVQGDVRESAAPTAVKTDAAVTETAIDCKDKNQFDEAEAFSTFHVLAKDGKGQQKRSSNERVQGDMLTSSAPKAADTDAALPETAIDCKEKNQVDEAEACSTFQNLGRDGKRQPLFQKVLSKERIEGDAPMSVAPKAAKTDVACPETAIDYCKDKNQFDEAEAFPTFQIAEKDGERWPLFQKISSKERVQGDVLTSAAAKADGALSEPAIDCKGKNQLDKAEAFSTFEITEKDGKRSSKERVQRDVLASAAPKDVKACSDRVTSDRVHDENEEGPKAAKTDVALPEAAIDSKDNRFDEAEACRTFQIVEKNGNRQHLFQTEASKESVQKNRQDVLMSAARKDGNLCSDRATSNSVRNKSGKERLIQALDKLANMA